jgi:hypothetical protein
VHDRKIIPGEFVKLLFIMDDLKSFFYFGHIIQITVQVMKKSAIVLLTAVMLLLSGCKNISKSLTDAITGATLSMASNGNSLFHQTEEKQLAISEIRIEGEVDNTGIIDLANFYKREVFIKETGLNKNNEQEFTGAFRYKGYSLFDLLHPYKLNKKNAELFRPAIDLYVIIENDKGETVSFSWSEIFHTNNPHQILIASEVAQIKPYRKEVEYETGETWKVVAAGDLFANRVLENPSRITVKSFDLKDYPINRDMDPAFSPEVTVIMENETVLTIPQITDETKITRYHSTFYGMGMGFHNTRYFDGYSLPALLQDSINLFDSEWIQNGLVCFASVDGYRAIFSYSELFNRIDQTAPLLSIPDNPEDGGYYRIFLQSDFYADRSVKALKEIYFFRE